MLNILKNLAFGLKIKRNNIYFNPLTRGIPATKSFK